MGRVNKASNSRFRNYPGPENKLNTQLQTMAKWVYSRKNLYIEGEQFSLLDILGDNRLISRFVLKSPEVALDIYYRARDWPEARETDGVEAEKLSYASFLLGKYFVQVNENNPQFEGHVKHIREEVFDYLRTHFNAEFKGSAEPVNLGSVTLEDFVNRNYRRRKVEISGTQYSEFETLEDPQLIRKYAIQKPLDALDLYFRAREHEHFERGSKILGESIVAVLSDNPDYSDVVSHISSELWPERDLPDNQVRSESEREVRGRFYGPKGSFRYYREVKAKK